MGRILAIDFGEKRIGLAISDDSQKIALPFGILDGRDIKKALEKLKDICRRKNIKKIILGLPLTLDGKEECAVKKTKNFAHWLEKTLHLPIIYEDERLTTKEAEKILKERGEKDKSKVDVISAVLILKQYLEGNEKV